MRILKPGQTVTLCEGTSGESSTSIEGIITAINITCELAIAYRVAWWSDRSHNEQWFGPCQIFEHHDAIYLELSESDKPDLDMESKVTKDEI